MTGARNAYTAAGFLLGMAAVAIIVGNAGLGIGLTIAGTCCYGLGYSLEKR